MNDSFRFSRSIATLLIILGCSGCASVYIQNENTYPDPKADQGLVYFYRESHIIGNAATYYVYEGDQKVGGLRNKSYFFIWAAPGEHVYSNRLEGNEKVTVQVEANKTYYIRGDVSAGIFAPHAEMIEVTAVQAMRSITNMDCVALSRDK